ncbi:hypothetical protein ACIOUE_03700 [Streptomyces xanthochromogenes]|uniref:hypothetical protein n=1 Tax=Streptomyces TaxID=1883 RepID=UPI00136FD268|nr:hypothetical protein [Streptomyces sp. SID1034]MYV95120.1 hypothetical protein [Streptomyces sp. SID1034]
MRIRPALTLLLAVTALAGCSSTSDNSPTRSTTSRDWEPDDALQRADRALDTDDTTLTVIDRNAPHVASGMNKTFDTSGNKPYRLDITCDSYEVAHLTLVLTRGQSKHTQDLPCGAREAQRLNIPAGPAFTATIAPAKAGTTGLIAWRLNTLDPHEVEGCTTVFAPCDGQPTAANSP